jgi:hypothetical protein
MFTCTVAVQHKVHPAAFTHHYNATPASTCHAILLQLLRMPAATAENACNECHLMRQHRLNRAIGATVLK